MPYWLIAALGAIAVLLAGKLLLAASIVTALPRTRGAMFHPSAPIRVKTFLDAVPLKSGNFLIDIGCGDGRVLKAAAQRYGIRALGYEINILAYLLGRIKLLSVEGVEIRFGDFWKANLAEADVVFCYLFPDVMKCLAEKLKSELRPGAIVVSCNFTLPGWRYEKILHPDSSLHGDPIYIYRYPDALNN